MIKERRSNRKTRRFLKKLAPVGAALLLALSLGTAVLAEETDGGTGDQTQTESAAEENNEEEEDPGAGDIEEEDTSVPFETDAGSAAVAEVIVSSGSGDVNIIDEPKEFENDAPSVTVTETFQSTDLSEDTPAEDKIETLTPSSTTYVLTEGGDTIRESDQDKVDLSDADVKVEEGDKTETSVTITRTSVTSSENAIQKAIDNALQYVTADTKSITVTVAAGTYNGDVKVSNDSLQFLLQPDTDFTLYVLGEGSYTAPEEGGIIDKTTINAEAGNAVEFGGMFDINGINMVLAGIYFTLDNSLKISDGSKVTIYGTEEGDGVNVTMTGGDNIVTIDTGGGSDKITAATAKGTETNFDNQLTIRSGPGKDTVKIEHGGGVLSADVDTGGGDDAFEVKAGADAVKSYTEGGVTANGSLKVQLGDGDDMVTVDASASKAFATAVVNGDAGYNMLSLTGKLNKDKDDPVSGTLAKAADNTYGGSISMYADGSDAKGTFSVSGFSAFTDTLENKKTVTVDNPNTADIKSFTNYKVNAKADKEVSANWSDAGKYGSLFFTNLLIEGDEVVLGTINVPTANLTVISPDITVNGAVIASSVVMTAKDTDVLFDFSEDVGETISGKVGGYLSGSLFDFNASAEITIS